MIPLCGCLSAEVDLMAGLAIGVVAIDGLRFVDDRRRLALAAVPVTLALHQLIEVGAWWGLEGRVPGPVETVSVFLYLLIALVVVPILVPFAVWSVEIDSRRRRWMLPFVWLGLLTGLALAVTLLAGSVTASSGGYFIDYQITSLFPEWSSAVYVAAVAAPFLLSSRRLFVGLGVANLVLVAAIGWLNARGFVSLWCAAAALESIVVVHYLRSEAGRPWIRPGVLRLPLAS